jgi:molybdopterin-guanine dinucleotide biosynthesis protein A
MEPTPPLAGLVLAGGASTRMGEDKALIAFEGRPLIQRVAGRVAAIAAPVLIATGVPGRFGPTGFAEVGDAVFGRGPLGGLLAGLEVAPHQLMAVVAVDMPYLSSELLAYLASLHDGEDVLAPVGDTGVEPLHAVYSRSALPAMRTSMAQGRYRLRGLLSELRVRRVGATEWAHLDIDPRFAFNVNRPEDLRTEI